MKQFLYIVLFATLISCAAGTDEQLEEAQFALDKGDWATAITKSNDALTADATNVEAALLLSSAYAGRAGVNILAISADISESGNTESIFNVVHDALANTITSGTGLTDVRNAIVALGTTLTQPATTHVLFKDQQFQLGILEAIESFALSSLTAQQTLDGTITTTDITTTHRDDTQTDFINVDNHLINGGMESGDVLVTNLRKNYCVLRNVTAAASGIDLTALQDLNLCQLSASTTGLTFQSGTVASCASFDFSSCNSATDTTLTSN
ncbi:MAG: hypothetical protein A3I05_03855 [Deltaproteobacteria bacterium RIFCSPLOWO2_02_FULL_44_10]|nr:MAG: hypothetical protein A3C46_07965 [Deltaproteobacteria bacterium RIFCSPHIGHO2_02_FULL_44_16]OGQ47098.1 MAG: hypothetical protein A3I05_03855 [Deltaproteobacteria bacterium RIFCSPLOWO2_02_FULL_44_10]